jgi:hypothetical protein
MNGRFRLPICAVGALMEKLPECVLSCEFRIVIIYYGCSMRFGGERLAICY